MKYPSSCKGFLVGILWFSLAATAMAQSDRGAISGTVTQPVAAAVTEAKVVLRNTESGTRTLAVTTGTGNYTFSSIPVGIYDLTVQANGFKTNVQHQLQVQLDQTVRVDIKLTIGSSTESITVESTAELLKT